MSGIIEWLIFGMLALIAVITAAGMLVTMSMYRAGLALMASFVALAGIFILLDADLLAMIQIMMNVGGMLIMILVMVMLMMDPGGQMMWDMKRSMHIRGLGAFSMTMPRGHHEATTDAPMPMDDHMHMPHGEQEATEEGADTPGMQHGGMDLRDGQQAKGAMKMSGMNAQQHYQMLVSMAMTTAQLPWALVVGAATAVALILLVVVTPWHLAGTAPSGDAAAIVGNLLLGRYMVGFEGAAFLIVAGIAGAVLLARREGSPPSYAQSLQAPTPAAQIAQPTAAKPMYTCPMHSEVQQDHPGKCPICGMDLVPQPPQRMGDMGGEQ